MVKVKHNIYFDRIRKLLLVLDIKQDTNSWVTVVCGKSMRPWLSLSTNQKTLGSDTVVKSFIFIKANSPHMSLHL